MKKKKKKAKDKVRLKIKEKKKLENRLKEETVKYRCLSCGYEEEIPEIVVMEFDLMDQGDTSVPPRFDCEMCDEQMEPVYYESVHGVIYDMEKKQSD